MKTMKIVDKVTKALAVTGSANWFLVGVANLDLVEKLAGSWMWLKAPIYVAVGVSGVYQGYYWLKKG